MKVLVVEDDRETNAYVARGLREAGNIVDASHSGKDGLLLAATGTHEVIVLDRLLPEVDGMTILRTLRASHIATPVLVLTALDGIDDRVVGLEAGADDYLVKPFAFAELLARVNALARRPPARERIMALKVGDLEIELMKRQVTRAGHRIELQPREYQILEYLARHAEHVVTRTMMLEAIWEFQFDPKTNIVETHMSRLRSKLHVEGEPDLIHTVRGAGYCLRAS